MTAVFLTASCLGAVWPATGAGTGSHRCGPSRAHTVQRSATARVYRVAGSDGPEIWACLYRTDRRTFLGEQNFKNFEGEAVEHVLLRGNYVARSLKDAYHSGGTFADVAVFDLRSGRRRHHWMHGGLACEGLTELRRLVATKSGGVAWTVEVQNGCGPWTKEVFKSDGRRRKASRLDSATTVDPDSLRLSHGRIHWTNAGVEKSAPLR